MILDNLKGESSLELQVQNCEDRNQPGCAPGPDATLALSQEQSMMKPLAQPFSHEGFLVARSIKLLRLAKE